MQPEEPNTGCHICGAQVLAGKDFCSEQCRFEAEIDCEFNRMAKEEQCRHHQNLNTNTHGGTTRKEPS
ncbi:MAG: hypothetical protein KKF30_07500 [Proteobacteria bacterium]|nr:hypothetical protein [Pseudomonadota bacterium]MBU4470287.1 hypothetical protein [Pseudomonadota bacterium]MCG2752700.1 hypothetical protein [Desulfobacteraceae bacterium]